MLTQNQPARRITPPQFKFHTGSMLTELTTLLNNSQNLFKFHTGSMLTEAGGTVKIAKIKFKFHTGSMLTATEMQLFQWFQRH